VERLIPEETPDDESEQLPRGVIIGGRYRIIRTIGRGGMGVVHEATNELTHGRVAIKTLSRAALSMDGAVQRFAREAKAAGSMRSVHVGRVLDAAVLDDGAPFLVMEFYEGRDLDGELRQYEGQLPIDDACSYIIQACAGLAEAHARGFVHRDLKPSNLFLAEEGGVRRVKVLDFGISKHLLAEDELTKSLAAIGTPLFMSPEQVRDAKYVDHRSDIWALGVILYRMLTGTRPFHGNATAVIAAILMEDPDPMRTLRPEIPEALEAVTLRALRKSHTERYETVEELATALAPFTQNEVARHALGEMRHALSIPPPSSSGLPESASEETESPTQPEGDATDLSVTQVDSSANVTLPRPGLLPNIVRGSPSVTPSPTESPARPARRSIAGRALVAGVVVVLAALAFAVFRREPTPHEPATPVVAPSSAPSPNAPPNPLPSTSESSETSEPSAKPSVAPEVSSVPSAGASASTKIAPWPKPSVKPPPSASASASASTPPVDPTIL